MVESLKKLSKSEIEQLPGEYDEDKFYILKDGSYYDDQGYFFNKWGFDADGSRYNENGTLVHRPVRAALDESTNQVGLSRDKIESYAGEYDEDGFYKLKNGAFYDPFGYYFDEEGFDVAGGKYDDAGFYKTEAEQE